MENLFKRTAKPDLHDSRDLQFRDKHNINATLALKSRVDLTNQIATPVYQQGLLNSCTACAISAMIEIMLRTENRPFNHYPTPDYSASPLYIYYNERALEGKIDINAGVYIKDGIKSVSQTGVCAESLWPYPTMSLPSNLKQLVAEGDQVMIMAAIAKAESENQPLIEQIIETKPSTAANIQAADYKIPRYYKLSTETNLNELKLCLSKGHAFVFGINEPLSFFLASDQGMLPPISVEEPRLGGHALVALGYDDSKQAFLVRNSYGTDFGMNGYCYLSYDFMCGYFLQNNIKTANTFSFWALLPD